jgi:hypothetical protein
MIEDKTIRNLSPAAILHLRGQEIQPSFWMLTSSSDVFSCTSCQRAFAASATSLSPQACPFERLARMRAALAFPAPERHAEPEDYRERCAQLTGKRISASTFGLSAADDGRRRAMAAPPRRELHNDTS